jgi:uncharacterized small protein (DUF1192 family)
MGIVTRLLLILALVGTAFWVYSIVDCALQPPTRHRGVSKGVWLAIVILLPVLGGVLWFVIGRGRATQARARRAPDDDPEFLGSITLGSIADQDERIRRLEEELAQLDAEADDPRDKPAAAGSSPEAPPASPGSAKPGTIDGDDDSRGQRGAVS